MKHILALSLVVVMPLASSAQVAAPGAAQAVSTSTPEPAQDLGITVTGHGVAAATVATVLVRVIARNIADDTGLPAALGTAGMEAGTADRGNRSLLLTVRGRLSAATPAKLASIQAAANAYAATHPPGAIVETTFYGTADACPAIEQRARDAALSDARRRAEALAKTTNVHIGGTLGLLEAGGCPQAGISGSGSVIDVSTMLMRIAVTETVTYAIAK